MMSRQVTTNHVQWSEHVRLIGVGILAGATAGLVMGIGARINMRIIALAAGLTPGFSAATLFILLLGLLLGIVPGILYVAIKKYLPGPRLWKGVTFGLLWSLLIGLLIFLIPVSAENDLSIGPPLLGRSLFTVLPIVYGIVLGLVEERLIRSVPAPNASRKSVYLYVVIAILVALGLSLLAAMLILHPSG
ncbi:MAG: hypothetical protein NVSMB38_09000 [Ktedonobacteraceae bacterium]